MQQIMKQAQQMQEQLMAAQAELAEMTFEGSAGGGVVKATVRGSNELIAVEIAPDVIDPSEPEMLQDLVVAAVNGAMRAASEAAESQMGGLAGGLGGLGGLLG
jgi:DNA-binding YbaB/EbfC family protein